MTFSWLRRRSRRAPAVLPSLDRLSELVERVIGLVDEVAVPPKAEAPAPVDGHVLFAPGADGYRLIARDGAAPACGSELEVEGKSFCVLRHGPSPFPGDLRRCVFLEREEPAWPERTLDG